MELVDVVPGAKNDSSKVLATPSVGLVLGGEDRAALKHSWSVDTPR